MGAIWWHIGQQYLMYLRYLPYEPTYMQAIITERATLLYLPRSGGGHPQAECLTTQL